MSDNNFLSIQEASKWASKEFNSNISPSNISYLIQYGQVKRHLFNGSVKVKQEDLKKYYSTQKQQEVKLKKELGEDLNWVLSFSKVKEYERTKHVHRLHSYKGKFIPQLVEYFLDSHTDNFKTEIFFEPGDTILDPFCGTGTTLVECKKQGIPSVGLEANPIAHFAAQVKLDWSLDPSALLKHAQAVSRDAIAVLERDGIPDEPDEPISEIFANQGKQESRAVSELRTLSPEKLKLLISRSISPLPLHKTLVLLDHLNGTGNPKFARHEKLSLAKALVFSISNLRFGPEVGIGKVKKDSAVVSAWLKEVSTMARDIEGLQSRSPVPATAHHWDSRNIAEVIEPKSIDAIITSPPYPNEKDYTRTTRLESVLLGFVDTKEGLRLLKKGLVRSNTRGVYKADTDDQWVADNEKIQKIAKAIEARRIELGKTSGFERLYHRVTQLYFGGMARHLSTLRPLLRPGAQLAYVVGDQASYLRIMIRTGQLLAEIAQDLGYELVGIDLFRTRLSTATGEQLREEVVILRWPG